MRRASRLACVAASLLALFSVAAPALADEKIVCSQPPGEEKYVCKVVVTKEGDDGGTGTGDGGDDEVDPQDAINADYCAWILGEGNEAVPDFCLGGAIPEQIARSMWPLEPPKPVVETAPPAGTDAAVGLPVWVWIDHNQWEPIGKRKSVAGAWAEVVATPETITVQPGDGRSITCEWPGPVYERGRKSPCSFVYARSSAGQPGSAYRMTVTITWGGAWTGSGGTGGVLPDITSTADVLVPVAEGQALN